MYIYIFRPTSLPGILNPQLFLPSFDLNRLIRIVIVFYIQNSILRNSVEMYFSFLAKRKYVVISLKKKSIKKHSNECRSEFLRGHGCSPEELIKPKVEREWRQAGPVKCFRCVLEAPRARRWAEIGRDIEGTGIMGRSSKGPRGRWIVIFTGGGCSMGRDPYYESALNRDSLDKSADNEEEKRMGKRESLPPASLGYFEATMETASISNIALEKLKHINEAKNIFAVPLNEEFLKEIAGHYICSRYSFSFRTGLRYPRRSSR